MIGYGRGGGGGFGGFPYRSSHQQGQDGNSNHNGRGRGRGGRGRGRGGGRQQQRSKRNNNNRSPSLSFQAELSIPSQQRGIIIGRGGTTIKWLKECTGAKIFVPSVQQQQQRQSRRGRQQQEQQGEHMNNTTNTIGAPQTVASSTNDASTNDQPTASTQQQQPHQTQEEHPVRVNTNELSNLLHAFYEISTLLSTTTTCTDINIHDGNSGDLLGENNAVHCIVKMKSQGAKKQPGAQSQHVDVKVDGHLFLHNHNQATQESRNTNSRRTEDENKVLERMLLFQGTVNNSNNVYSAQQQLVYQAYCIATQSLFEEDIATIVDNVRFVNTPSMMGDVCQWFYREVPLLFRNNNSSNLSNEEEEQEGDGGMSNSSSDCVRCLVFVFGPEVGNPLSICQAIAAEQSQRVSEPVYGS